MSTVSDRLQLALTPASDVTKKFISWRTELAGDTDSNMTKIDSAVADLQDNKQDKLSGTNGQVVGFDSEGNAVAQDTQKPKYVSITLTAAGWDTDALTQVVSVSGILADETAQLIHPTPAVVSQVAYIESGILCTGQATDSLTFTATTVPTDDLIVYVVMQGVTG